MSVQKNIVKLFVFERNTYTQRTENEKRKTTTSPTVNDIW